MRVLAVQSDNLADLEENTSRAVETIRSHSEVDLIAFCELYLSGYVLPGVADRAISVDGEHLGRIRDACAESETAAIVGFAERLDGRVANALAAIDSRGELVGIYRKAHLFGEGEQDAFAPGDTLVVADLDGVRCGLMICFDTEFPEPARELARAGAEVLVTASSNMEPYAADHELAARARALDNRIPHIYVNRCGRDGSLVFVGESRIIGPEGQVIAELGDESGELIAELPTGSKPPDQVDYLAQVRGDLTIDPSNRIGGEIA